MKHYRFRRLRFCKLPESYFFLSLPSFIAYFLEMKIKICGITRPEDGRLAAELGADALGFVFYEKSPRNIPPEKAAEIAVRLPAGVAKVGVFVAPDREFAATVAQTVGLDAIQLHGITRPEEWIDLPGTPVILAVPVRADGPDPAAAALMPRAAAVLLDTHHSTLPGGTGKTFNWAYAAAMSRQRHIILAGGLTPDNIRAAVETVHPRAVDVSSGVEAAPGIKDPGKLQQFFANCEAYRDDPTEKGRFL